MEQSKVRFALQAKTVADARRDKGISKKELAKILGISTDHLYLWENGASGVPYDRIYSVNKALGVHIERAILADYELFLERWI